MWMMSKRGFFARGVVVAGTLLAALMPPGAAAQGPTRALTDAYNTSGQELFRQLAAAPGNIVMSPYSIGTAMAMALAGARGETAQEMMMLAQRTTRALERAYSPDGTNIGLNLGKAAGAGVADHLHMHVLPRWFGDTNFMTVTSETRVLPEILEQSWQRLRDAFAVDPALLPGTAPL